MTTGCSTTQNNRKRDTKSETKGNVEQGTEARLICDGSKIERSETGHSTVDVAKHPGSFGYAFPQPQWSLSLEGQQPVRNGSSMTVPDSNVSATATFTLLSKTYSAAYKHSKR